MKNLNKGLDDEALWVSQGWGKEIDLEKKRELKLAKKLNKIEQMLKNIYFFTEDQIYDVFNKNTDSDWYFFEQIIRDVEQQYAKMQMDIPINEYLYENLMSINSLDITKRQEEITDNIHEILDWDDVKNLSYMDFLPHNTFSEEMAWKKMKEYVKQHVQDFFVVRIDEDVAINKESRQDKSRIDSKLIQKYISWSSMQGINFFVFVQKDWTKRIAIGVQKGTTGTTNDFYFSDLAKKYNATKITIPLSHFIT